jgi:lipopolysaccharide biosynthesis glycosyltransferase
MKPVVPVVFATDDIFAPYCSVAIASLIANRDRQRSYALYIFYDDLSEKNVGLLSGMATQNVSIECLCVTRHVDRTLLYTRNGLTVATYFRFFVADMLPQYDKLLYLDSDIVVLRDVGKLLDMDIGDSVLGGVSIYRGNPKEILVKVDYLKKTMDVTPDRYINTGVLLINLTAFRAEGVKDACIRYIGEHRELRWLDQDTLNAVCMGKIQYLPEDWNKSQYYYEADYAVGVNLDQVGIVHYITDEKPWKVPLRFTQTLFYLYTLTPYRDELARTCMDVNIQTKHFSLGEWKNKMMQLAGDRKIGPRFFLHGLRLWAEGKCDRLRAAMTKKKAAARKP